MFEVIRAEKMDSTYVYVLCPYCCKNSNKYTSINNATKNHKRVYHTYNTIDFRNRTMQVKSHCLFNVGDTFKIKIDNNTLKIKE